MDQFANSLVAVIGYALVAGVPGYFVLQPWALNRFRGGWRIAAMVPLIGAVLTGLWSLYALSQDSNLWPLTFIFFAPAGALYLVVLALLRHFAGAAA
jgi:hypothetical protein